ncbi:MAG TPA: hypothetical protein VIL86_17570 [Tepidisphaeraceae bacterium]|jgi:hypothetical protein
MADAELRDIFQNVSNAMLIRSLLVNELERIGNSGEEPEQRTMRGLWYSLINARTVGAAAAGPGAALAAPWRHP